MTVKDNYFSSLDRTQLVARTLKYNSPSSYIHYILLTRTQVYWRIRDTKVEIGIVCEPGPHGWCAFGKFGMSGFTHFMNLIQFCHVLIVIHPTTVFPNQRAAIATKNSLNLLISPEDHLQLLFFL